METMRHRVGREIDKGLEAGCRRAVMAMAIAGALVATEGIVGVAKAEPRPSGAMQKPNATVPSVDFGAGMDMKTRDIRPRAVISLRTTLADGLRLSNAIGIHTRADGAVRSEEVNTDLSLRIIGPLSLRAFGQNSRHLGVQKYSVGGEVGFKIPVGTLFAGTRYIFDHGQILPFGGVTLDLVPERLTFLALGGHTTNTGATIARLGVTVTPVQGMPSIVLDSFNTINGGKLVFSDVTAGLRFIF